MIVNANFASAGDAHTPDWQMYDRTLIRTRPLAWLDSSSLGYRSSQFSLELQNNTYLLC